ncbi:UDP-N-acetylglucosamine 4,6-dehydratase (inverting) [Paracoccaceae bacterium]|nr:UDP-N-acetylglucosamine 4,6-dehydratase (inverting) [Paracoccaceae bacterium]
MKNFINPVPNLDAKTVLVTGGTGSFGRAFVKEVLDRFTPKKLIIFSRDELKQFDFKQSLDDREKKIVRFFIGDVRDLSRLTFAMRDVDIVVHAAAMKQVEAAEYNPFECIKTNIMGAQNVVDAAIHCNVKKVVALSTDKAASPINLYGASKLASDKIFVAGNNVTGSSDTRFSVVRYGNVIGSRGSVVPFFEKLIQSGAKELPITHPEMTRFWITLSQGVNFVLSSISLMVGGEIFVPKLPSMRVVDVARALAPEIDHVLVGIRPGEKLHEIMINRDDARLTLDYNDRYIIQPDFAFWDRNASKYRDLKPVQDQFSYSSETNVEWLTEQDFRLLRLG